MNIRIPTKVMKLEERKRVISGKKVGDDAVLTSQTIGWFVHFEGSYESLFVGYEKPVGLDPGTEVDILIVPRQPRA